MDKFVEKIAELAEKFGPHVIDAARGAVRVEAYSSMASATISAIVFVALILLAKVLWSYEARDKYNDGIPRAFSFLVMVLALIPFCMTLWVFIDPWIWVAINNPDLYLAKKIFKL